MAQVHCASSGSRICLLSEDIGKQQVFSTFDPVRGREEEVARIDFEGDQVWDLSPDGRWIAMVEFGSDKVRIFDLETKRLQVVHPMPAEKGLQTPAWSADGKALFITALSDSGLYKMDLTGHLHLLLKNPSGWVGLPAPSPDGKRIAYTNSVGESNVTLLEHF